jgi:hypothetical protein
VGLYLNPPEHAIVLSVDEKSQIQALDTWQGVAFTAGGPNYGTGCVDQTGSNGNISADPLFVNSVSDFHLQSTSPAIDAGSNSAPDLPTQDIAETTVFSTAKGSATPSSISALTSSLGPLRSL